jgi:hypothetical protein
VAMTARDLIPVPKMKQIVDKLIVHCLKKITPKFCLCQWKGPVEKSKKHICTHNLIGRTVQKNFIGFGSFFGDVVSLTVVKR